MEEIGCKDMVDNAGLKFYNTNVSIIKESFYKKIKMACIFISPEVM